MILGYVAGAFDMFHVGHLKFLNNARGLCDRLVVGVMTDDLMEKAKEKKLIIC